MQPSLAIIDSLAELVASDVNFLAEAAVKRVHLMLSAFTPSPEYEFDPLEEATFDGYANLTAPAGAQQFFTNPITGERVVQLIEPVGGWHWLTTGTTDLPQTIFGFVVTDAASAVTHGSALLDTPVTLQAVGEAVDLDQVRLTFILNPMV